MNRPSNRSSPTEVQNRLESTDELLARIRGGEDEARDRLVERYFPALLRWAHGRLPAYARDLMDTDDLVLISFMRTLDRLKEFKPEREGAFLAYLRQVLMNRIREEIRKLSRRPARGPLNEEITDRAPSPLDNVIGAELLQNYETALAALNKRQQEAVILRIELGFSYPQIAEAIGSVTPNAARMFVARSLVRLGEKIHAERSAGPSTQDRGSGVGRDAG